jgi:uncharacterized membrane protein YqjE
MHDKTPGDGKGLLASLTALAATLVAIVHTRLDLLSSDLEEERAHVLSLLVLSLSALFFLGIGVLLVTLLVVVAFWDTYRLLVLAVWPGCFWRPASRHGEWRCTRREPSRNCSRRACRNCRKTGSSSFHACDCAYDEKSAHLIEQRENLIRLAAQRTALAQAIEPWRMPLARVDQGLTVLRTIKRNPAWIVGGVVSSRCCGLIASRSGCAAVGWRGRCCAGCAEGNRNLAQAKNAQLRQTFLNPDRELTPCPRPSSRTRKRKNMLC